MYKVGICGRFGYNSGSVNGQTDKTVAVYNAVAKAIGKENIALINQKCHDMKHHIRALRTASKEDRDKYLDELDVS